MPPRTPYNRRAAWGARPAQRAARRDGSGSAESVLRLVERGEFLVREGRTDEAVRLYRRMQREPGAGALEPWLSDTLAALLTPQRDPATGN